MDFRPQKTRMDHHFIRPGYAGPPSIAFGEMASSLPDYQSQRPPPGLLALDRLEQGLEIPLPEAPCPATLDDLEEQRRPIFHRLGENLEQVTLVVAVHEDAQLRQFAQVLPD